MGVCGLPFSSPSIFQPAFCITSSCALLFRLRPNSLMFVEVLLLLFYEFSKYLQRLRRHRTICTVILKFFFWHSLRWQLLLAVGLFLYSWTDRLSAALAVASRLASDCLPNRLGFFQMFKSHCWLFSINWKTEKRFSVLALEIVRYSSSLRSVSNLFWLLFLCWFLLMLGTALEMIWQLLWFRFLVCFRFPILKLDTGTLGKVLGPSLRGTELEQLVDATAGCWGVNYK